MNKDQNRLITLVHQATQASLSVRLLLTVVGASLFLGVTTLVIVGGLALDRVFGRSWDLTSLWSIVIAAPELAAAFYFMLWSAGKFFLSQGSPVPMNPPPKLVTDGLYRYTRNPMQTGLYGVLIGFSILFQSPGALLFTCLWMALMTLWLVKIEEPEMALRLGQEYLDYKKRVPRWGVTLRRRG